MKILRRIEKFLFYFLVFAIPFGTRKVLYEWPQPASAAGKFFNEWESVSFYFTDGLLLLLILAWIFTPTPENSAGEDGDKRLKKGKFSNVFQGRKHKFLVWGFNGGRIRLKNWPLGVFLILAGVSIAAAQNPALGLYHWLRLAEMAIFFIYVRDRFRQYDFGQVLGVFISSAALQSFIAIGQAMWQKSLGLKILGESVLNPGMINVAKFVSQGTKILRAYGTLPHPNVLAAFLAAAIFFLLFLYFRNAPPVGGRSGIFVFVPLYFLLLFALFLTFSRGITLIFIFVLLCWLVFLFVKERKRLGPKIIYAALILAVSYGLLSAVFYRREVAERYQFSAKEEAVSFRLFYIEVAVKMIDKNPVLGVGMGNFVLQMDDYLSRPLKIWDYQPVHNIFLMVGAELGLAALAVFVWFLVSVVKKPVLDFSNFQSTDFLKNSLFLALFFSFILYGLFDHFFWTLQPAKLTFWLVFGIIAARRI